MILIWTTNYYTSIYDIFLPTSGLTGTQDWLFVMKNNQCCVGAPLLWIMDPIRYVVCCILALAIYISYSIAGWPSWIANHPGGGTTIIIFIHYI